MLADRHIAHDKRIAIAIGLALMLATYLVFSVRSLLNPVSPGDLLSLKRLITAVLGAGLFLLVAHRASRTLKRGPARIAPVLIYSAISFIALLTIRIAYDLFVAGVTDAVLAANVRWMMSWVGYFGAALATYYALTPARAAVRREAATAPLSRIPDYEEADPAARALTAG